MHAQITAMQNSIQRIHVTIETISNSQKPSADNTFNFLQNPVTPAYFNQPKSTLRKTIELRKSEISYFYKNLFSI